LVTEDGWEVETRTVKSATKVADGSYDVTVEDNPNYFGNGFFIPADRVKGELKPGDDITLYVGGNFVRGYEVNEVEWHYMTREEAEAERQEWLAKNEARKKKEFEDNIDDYMSRMVVLPPPFYKRLKAFENKYGFEEFWTESGAYELFVYEQAVLLANAAKKHGGNAKSQAAWIQYFKELPPETQLELVEGMSQDHSGNTFGGMIWFATRYVEGTLETNVG
jgi:hypothetical protein